MKPFGCHSFDCSAPLPNKSNKEPNPRVQFSGGTSKEPPCQFCDEPMHELSIIHLLVEAEDGTHIAGEATTYEGKRFNVACGAVKPKRGQDQFSQTPEPVAATCYDCLVAAGFIQTQPVVAEASTEEPVETTGTED